MYKKQEDIVIPTTSSAEKPKVHPYLKTKIKPRFSPKTRDKLRIVRIFAEAFQCPVSNEFLASQRYLVKIKLDKGNYLGIISPLPYFEELDLD